jgi:ferredoxin-type protein NapH
VSATASAVAVTSRRRSYQRLRQASIIVSLLLFPVIINYLSPYLSMESASLGIVNGSMIAFACMFISSLFLGRAWCGWLCPGAGLQEVAFAINDHRARGSRWDWLKWVLWVPWIGTIAAMAVSAGGYRSVNPFYNMDSFISTDAPERYGMYYAIVGGFFLLSVVAGRRATCHYICWMAPFMVIGRSIRNQFGWPSLRLKVDQTRCINCKRCTQACPMSLDVSAMVQQGTLENKECILCRTCVDTCPKETIKYSFSAGKR